MMYSNYDGGLIIFDDKLRIFKIESDKCPRSNTLVHYKQNFWSDTEKNRIMDCE